MTITDSTASAGVDPAAAEQFGARIVSILNDASIALLTSIGHQTGLFETLAALPDASSNDIAAAADLNERYVREWLAGMTAARIITYDPVAKTYRLPPEHAAVLTRAAGPGNLAPLTQYIPLFGGIEQKVISRFRAGGGLSYSDYPRFHQMMSQVSGVNFDFALLDAILPLVPGLSPRPEAGLDVADVGCGSGHALNLMAAAFPRSRFTGYDFSEEAVTYARTEAERRGLSNVTFVVRDIKDLCTPESFDLITAFDAIHDQAQPATVLSKIHDALRAGGTFLMVDIGAASTVEDNIGLPWASFLYTMSTMHCMSVSLGQGGEGLGTAWGEQLAARMVTEAGLTKVRTLHIESDPFNAYFTVEKA